MLEEVAETAILNSITLLEGVPFERELQQLKSRYQTVKFEGLFRAGKISTQKSQYRESFSTETVPPPQNGIPPAISQYRSPYQPTIGDPNLMRTPSGSTNSSAALNPKAPSWATLATKPALASPPLTPQPTIAKSVAIPRNRYGQRVDPVLTYDPLEVKRIKKLKMCNVHFLRGDCPYDPCTHEHDYKPTKNEVQTLRYVSRMTPCKFGAECDDLRCIYGHKCPNDREGSRECKWGENCRFEREAHGIERRIVDTIKIGGK